VGNGEGVIVKVGDGVTTGVKLIIGIEDGRKVAVGETAVKAGAHAFTRTTKRTKVANDVSFFNILSPVEST